MKYITILAFIVLSLITACTKENTGKAEIISQDSTRQLYGNQAPASTASTILIDATKDGGVWWYPQSGPDFSSSLPHQGKALTDYLVSLGFTTVAIPRGQSISWTMLKQYKKVVRVGGYGNYSQAEIAAYDSLLENGASLLLLQDHLQNFPNDNLSSHLGLNFQGSVNGQVNSFISHTITSGISPFPYIAGSVIGNPDPSKMTILGFVNGDPLVEQGNGLAVMGILHHTRSKIFFLGDINGLEQVPQPFAGNLVKWLFQ